jgi:4-amino-4-deoxy-L-arabinose transferase-like glycosyltransferase
VIPERRFAAASPEAAVAVGSFSRHMRSAGPVVATARTLLDRVPRALAALLALVTIFGFAWSLAVPPFQVIDEYVHFAYVQNLVENGKLPGAKGRPTFSSEERFAEQAAGALVGRYYPDDAPPNWSRSAWQRYLARAEKRSLSSSDGGGPNPATNPPLFYAYDAIPYLLDHGGTTFGQLYAMRLWGVVLLDLTALGGWLIAAEVFGRRQSLQLVVGAICALMPMSTYLSTGVNPDALLITLWTLALWLGVRVIRRGTKTADAVGLCAVAACAVLTQAESYALVVPVLTAFFAASRFAPSPERRATVVRGLKALPVLFLPVIAWLGFSKIIGFAAVTEVGSAVTAVGSGPAGHRVTMTGFLDYLWQFYLPRLPFMPVVRLNSSLSAFVEWSGQGIGHFGVESLALPLWVYDETVTLSPFIGAGVLGAVVARGSNRKRAALFGVTAVTVVALHVVNQVQYASTIPALMVLAVMFVAVRPLFTRRPWSAREAVLLLFASAVFTLLLLLHWEDYGFLVTSHYPFIEGRYLLPLISIFGLGVALIVTEIPARLRAVAVGLVLAALLGLQLVSLATIVHGYYL